MSVHCVLRSTLVTSRAPGLDVLEDEAGRNPFADLPQVVLTPHIAGRSRKSAAAAMQVALWNINRYIQGQPPQYPVPGTDYLTTLVETR
jgi:phosphoglycerate dehydrogenase-like enzyme